MAYVAPSEWEKGCVRVKDLRVSEEAVAAGAVKETDVPFASLGAIDSFFGPPPWRCSPALHALPIAAPPYRPPPCPAGLSLKS
jgi:hypothetical protein